MTTVLTPSPKQKFFDNNGAPAAQYKLFTYQAATATKLATYVDSVGVTQNTNPIILDFRGECNLWIPPNVAYKYVFASPTDTDPPANPLWTVDNIVSSQLITLYGGVDTGIVNAYVLNFTANFTAYADGIVIYWIPSHTNTAASTINVNGLGVVNVINADGTALSAAEIQLNVPSTIIFKGGSFLVVNPPTSAIFATGSFTATVTGCTTAPTKTVIWARAGNIVTLNVPPTGLLVSNSTSFGMSGLPLGLQIAPGVPSFMVGGVFATDNGVATYAGGDAFVQAVSGNITFEFKGGLWTNAGNKSMGQFVLTYFISSTFG